jgi:hypothetical protein
LNYSSPDPVRADPVFGAYKIYFSQQITFLPQVKMLYQKKDFPLPETLQARALLDLRDR